MLLLIFPFVLTFQSVFLTSIPCYVLFLLQLETFKRQLMQSLTDENSSVRIVVTSSRCSYSNSDMMIVSFGYDDFLHMKIISYDILFLKPAETVDIGTCDQSVPKAYPDKGT